MKSDLTPVHLAAIEETLTLIGRGFEPRSLMNKLLFDLFPNEDQKFLDYWAGYRYVHLKGTAFLPSREWILTDMVREVVQGTAQTWFEDWLQEHGQVVA
jgi:hypothetical protein